MTIFLTFYLNGVNACLPLEKELCEPWDFSKPICNFQQSVDIPHLDICWWQCCKYSMFKLSIIDKGRCRERYLQGGFSQCSI